MAVEQGIHSEVDDKVVLPARLQVPCCECPSLLHAARQVVSCGTTDRLLCCSSQITAQPGSISLSCTTDWLAYQWHASG